MEDRPASRGEDTMTVPAGPSALFLSKVVLASNTTMWAKQIGGRPKPDLHETPETFLLRHLACVVRRKIY